MTALNPNPVLHYSREQPRWSRGFIAAVTTAGLCCALSLLVLTHVFLVDGWARLMQIPGALLLGVGQLGVVLVAIGRMCTAHSARTRQTRWRYLLVPSAIGATACAVAAIYGYVFPGEGC